MLGMNKLIFLERCMCVEGGRGAGRELEFNSPVNIIKVMPRINGLIKVNGLIKSCL